MNIDQHKAMLSSQRVTAQINVELAETALATAERELQRLDDELDRVSELQWQAIEARMRRLP